VKFVEGYTNQEEIKMGKKAKISVFLGFLILAPVVKGNVKPPMHLNLYEISNFFKQIIIFWIQHIESLIGPSVGVV
jgi:hypothetical protein